MTSKPIQVLRLYDENGRLGAAWTLFEGMNQLSATLREGTLVTRVELRTYESEEAMREDRV